MSEGVAALLGAIIGGGMVVLGDLVARRSEARRAARSELRAAVAELLSFEWHRHILAAYRRNHNPEYPEPEMWATHDRERRLAAATIAINPLAGDISPLAETLIRRTNELLHASSSTDEDWEAAQSQYKDAVFMLQRRTRELDGRSLMTRRWRIRRPPDPVNGVQRSTESAE